MTERFPDPLEVITVDGRKRLVVAFRYHAADGELIAVPVDFETDFASVPRALWWWLPPHGRYERAAVIHDWICACGGRVPRVDGTSFRVYTSHQAADLFGEAMAVLGVWKLRRAVMVWAVKMFGPRF